MTTPTDAIAGLSESLKGQGSGKYGYCMVFNGTLIEAATAIDALQADNHVKEQAIADMAHTIYALQARVKELEAKRDEARKAADLGCDAHNGGSHNVMADGSYKFCGDCGETIKNPTLQERARAAEARVKELERENGILRDMLLNPDPDIEPDNLRLHREKCDAIGRALIAESRALRAEQELDTMNDNHRVMARQMANLGRALIKAKQDRDEAIAALKPFVDVAEEMLSRGWDASNVALALDNPNEPHRVTAGDFFAIYRLAGSEKEGE